jgi:hypothetical protein
MQALCNLVSDEFILMRGGELCGCDSIITAAHAREPRCNMIGNESDMMAACTFLCLLVLVLGPCSACCNCTVATAVHGALMVRSHMQGCRAMQHNSASHQQCNPLLSMMPPP